MQSSKEAINAINRTCPVSYSGFSSPIPRIGSARFGCSFGWIANINVSLRLSLYIPQSSCQQRVCCHFPSSFSISGQTYCKESTSTSLKAVVPRFLRLTNPLLQPKIPSLHQASFVYVVFSRSRCYISFHRNRKIKHETKFLRCSIRSRDPRLPALSVSAMLLQSRHYLFHAADRTSHPP